jgi:hypothetical protein
MRQFFFYNQLLIAQSVEFLMAPSAKILRHTIEHRKHELWRGKTIRKTLLFFPITSVLLLGSLPLHLKESLSLVRSLQDCLDLQARLERYAKS